MKRFSIKMRRHNDRDWCFLALYPIFAMNYMDAKEKFKDWFIDKMDRLSTEPAKKMLDEIRGADAQETYIYENDIYTIRRIK